MSPEVQVGKRIDENGLSSILYGLSSDPYCSFFTVKYSSDVNWTGICPMHTWFPFVGNLTKVLYFTEGKNFIVWACSEGDAPIFGRALPACVVHFVADRLCLMEYGWVRVLSSGGTPGLAVGVVGSTRVEMISLCILTRIMSTIGNLTMSLSLPISMSMLVFVIIAKGLLSLVIYGRDAGRESD